MASSLLLRLLLLSLCLAFCSAQTQCTSRSTVDGVPLPGVCRFGVWVVEDAVAVQSSLVLMERSTLFESDLSVASAVSITIQFPRSEVAESSDVTVVPLSDTLPPTAADHGDARESFVQPRYALAVNGTFQLGKQVEVQLNVLEEEPAASYVLMEAYSRVVAPVDDLQVAGNFYEREGCRLEAVERTLNETGTGWAVWRVGVDCDERALLSETAATIIIICAVLGFAALVVGLIYLAKSARDTKDDSAYQHRSLVARPSRIAVTLWGECPECGISYDSFADKQNHRLVHQRGVSSVDLDAEDIELGVIAGEDKAGAKEAQWQEVQLVESEERSEQKARSDKSDVGDSVSTGDGVGAAAAAAVAASYSEHSSGVDGDDIGAEHSDIALEDKVRSVEEEQHAQDVGAVESEELEWEAPTSVVLLPAAAAVEDADSSFVSPVAEDFQSPQHGASLAVVDDNPAEEERDAQGDLAQHDESVVSSEESELADFLTNYGLHHLRDQFKRDGITVDRLQQMEMRDIRMLGLPYDDAVALVEATGGDPDEYA